MGRRWIASLISGAVGTLLLAAANAQGPDDKGAVLVSPLTPAAKTAPAGASQPVGAPGLPSSVQQMFSKPATDPSGRRTILALEDVPDINGDLQVTPAAGNWLIYIISYPGTNGPARARAMALELREQYRVPSYVFYYGAEERRKEYERVKKILDKQQEFFKQHNLAPDQPLRIRHQNIDVNHAVLIGGYPDADAARRALDQVRRWAPPDAKKVALETKFYQRPDDKGKGGAGEHVYVNPFQRAFVCRNPSIKSEAVPAEEKKLDVQTLKRMNSDESLSLFNNKKAFTLAVKEFQTPYMIHDRTTPASVWDTLGFSGKGERVDGAAVSAHNLAETLRKIKLDAYVLHTKFSSVVTVGAYDRADDPALKSMQTLLAERFNQQPFTQIQFFHRPVPMAVPK